VNQSNQGPARFRKKIDTKTRTKRGPFIQSSHVRLEDDDELVAQRPYYIVAVRVDGLPITMR